MTILNLSLSQNPDRGPLIEVAIALCSIEADRRRASNLTVPPEVRLTAQIDTGADVSSIDRPIIHQLGLHRYGPITRGTSRSGNRLIPSGLYWGNLIVMHGSSQIHWGDMKFAEADFGPGVGIEVLLGRDFLERCVFIYNGQSRTFTITF